MLTSYPLLEVNQITLPNSSFYDLGTVQYKNLVDSFIFSCVLSQMILRGCFIREIFFWMNNFELWGIIEYGVIKQNMNLGTEYDMLSNKVMQKYGCFCFISVKCCDFLDTGWFPSSKLTNHNSVHDLLK